MTNSPEPLLEEVHFIKKTCRMLRYIRHIHKRPDNANFEASYLGLEIFILSQQKTHHKITWKKDNKVK